MDDDKSKQDLGDVPEDHQVQEPVGLDKVGDETASRTPDEEISIELPIEENDFNAQTQ